MSTYIHNYIKLVQIVTKISERCLDTTRHYSALVIKLAIRAGKQCQTLVFSCQSVSSNKLTTHAWWSLHTFPHAYPAPELITEMDPMLPTPQAILATCLGAKKGNGDQILCAWNGD